MNSINGLWHKNPIFIQMLGLSPLLALSQTATKGLTLGLLTAFIGFIALQINHQIKTVKQQWWRFLWFVFLLSSLTTATGTLLQLQLFALHQALGLYLPLIACNLALLITLEDFSSNMADASLKELSTRAFIFCLSIIIGFILFSGLREFLVFGTLFRDWYLLDVTKSAYIDGALNSRSSQYIHFFYLQPGAFILLGLLIAALNLVREKLKVGHGPTNPNIEKVKRARVTGKL